MPIVTQAEALARADQIRDEAGLKANTATRVGQLLHDAFQTLFGRGALSICGTEVADNTTIYTLLTADSGSAGLYQLSLTAQSGPDSDTGQVGIVVKKNGTEIFGVNVRGASESGALPRGFDCAMVKLVATDVLTVAVIAEGFSGAYAADWGLVAQKLTPHA